MWIAGLRRVAGLAGQLGRRASGRRVRRSGRPPAGLDFAQAAIARDPFPHYESLRRLGSVHFLPRHDAWMVLGYDEVQSAFRQPGVFSNFPYTDIDAVLLGADPPAHAPVRRIVAQLVAGDALARLETFAAARAAALLAPRLDLVASFSGPLTEAVAGRLLGWPDETLDAIRTAVALNPETAALIATLDALAVKADIYPGLLADGMSDAQARSLVRLLWLAATTTTGRVIASCALRLLTDPPLADALRRDEALVAAFVDEVLRLHPPELMVPRVTTEAVSLGERHIPAGALVHLCIAAANRDPAKFERPSDLWLARPSARHLAFGYGIHHCVGALLGRRTIETAVRAVLAHAPGFRAVEPLDTAVTWCSMTASPVGRLLVEFTP